MSDITDQLDCAVRLRPATEGRPEDGPYPASVDEVADEVITWLREMDRTSARGLVDVVRAKLSRANAAYVLGLTDEDEIR